MLNNIGVGKPFIDAHHFWADIADSPEMDEKWHIDSAALAHRLRAMLVVSRIAIVEACGRFWERCREPTDEAMKAARITLRA